LTSGSNISPPSGSIPTDLSRHFSALIHAFGDPVLTRDLNGKILSWNQAASRVFGYAPEEIIGQSVLQLVPSDFHHEENELQRKLRAGEPISPYETDWLTKGGGKVRVLVTVYPVYDDGGAVIGASKLACDLSKGKDESRFRLAAIVDSADDGILSKDLNGIVLSWNEGAHRMFGYTAQEMIGQSILRLIPEELHYEEDEILRKLRAGERIEHYETTRQRKDGSRIDVSVTISPIRDGSGRVTGASKIARDISDRKRIERLLIQSEKLAATGRMAATIAHEINNPLESVVNLIFLARHHCPADGKANEYLLTAEEELERVSHIARQTLGYYRDTSSPTPVYLHDLIENVLTVYNSKLIANGIGIDKEFNDLQKIVVSKGEMLQVFANVIANAVDAMRNGGSLKISVRKIGGGTTGDGIRTVIRDNGEGIAQENMERIFEPFFTTKGNVGTGIGLWIAKQLIERRGGQISFSSSTEKSKSGTAVTIFLPMAMPISRLASELE
jgi:PAS domain S-box-containing protein